MGMGFGAGMGGGKGSETIGEAGAAGAGWATGVEPIAVIVVFKGVSGPEGVKVMSLKVPDHLSRAIGEISHAAVDIMARAAKWWKERVNKRMKKTGNKRRKEKINSNVMI